MSCHGASRQNQISRRVLDIKNGGPTSQDVFADRAGRKPILDLVSDRHEM